MTFSVRKLKTFSPQHKGSINVHNNSSEKKEITRKGKKVFGKILLSFIHSLKRYQMPELYPTHIHYTHI